MERKPFFLEIYTPDRTFFTGEVSALTVSAETGKMGIMCDTLPIVAVLTPGTVRFLQQQKWSEAFSASGFVSARKGIVSIFVENCRWPHEPAEEVLPEEMENEVEKLRKKESMREYQMAKARLAIQFAKLRKNDRDI